MIANPFNAQTMAVASVDLGNIVTLARLEDGWLYAKKSLTQQ